MRGTEADRPFLPFARPCINRHPNPPPSHPPISNLRIDLLTGGSGREEEADGFLRSICIGEGVLSRTISTTASFDAFAPAAAAARGPQRAQKCRRIRASAGDFSPSPGRSSRALRTSLVACLQDPCGLVAVETAGCYVLWSWTTLCEWTSLFYARQATPPTTKSNAVPREALPSSPAHLTSMARSPPHPLDMELPFALGWPSADRLELSHERRWMSLSLALRSAAPSLRRIARTDCFQDADRRATRPSYPVSGAGKVSTAASARGSPQPWYLNLCNLECMPEFWKHQRC